MRFDLSHFSHRKKWIVAALLAISFSTACTQMVAQQFSRYVLQCFMNNCDACTRAVLRTLIPPTRLPTQAYKNLSPFIEQSGNGAYRHQLSDPMYGFYGVEFAPSPLSLGFHFRNRFDLPLIYDGGVVNNYFALRTTTQITLAGLPIEVINNPQFPLDGAPFFLGTHATRGGVRMTATQGNHTEVIGSPNYGDSRFHCSNPNTATPFTLSQTSPVVIEIIANFSDGPLTSAPSGGTYVSDAIVMGFQSFNPNPSVCNQNVYSISDPLRPPGSLTLQDVVNAGWLTVPSTLLLQPTAADSAEFGLSPCPYAP